MFSHSLVQADLPDIGNSANQALSLEEEKKLGASFYRGLQQRDLISDDTLVNHYIQSIGNRITSGVGEQTFTFFVVKNNDINAFAVPGGYIGIHQGLILAARNEAELASVIAHEIAHVTQRHIARFYANGNKAIWLQMGAFLTAIALASQGSNEAATAAVYAGSAASIQSRISHTRMHELEADRIGIRYLARAGYDPKQMANFFEILLRKSGGNQRFEVLRTHPLNSNRVAEARALANRLATKEDATVSTPRFELIKQRVLVAAADNTQLLRHFKKHPKALNDIEKYTFALLNLQKNDTKTAKKALYSLLKKQPHTLEYELPLIQALIQEKSHIAAGKHLETLNLLYPDDEQITLQQALYFRAIKNFKKSKEVIENYTKKPKSNDMLLILAQSYQKTGNQPMAQFTQGQYLFNKGEYRGARVQIQEALKKKSVFNKQQLNVMNTLLETIQEEQRKG